MFIRKKYNFEDIVKYHKLNLGNKSFAKIIKNPGNYGILREDLEGKSE